MVGVRTSRTRPDVTVGKILSEARARLAVTIEQASFDLNIPVKHLQALEAGDLAVFPAEVYARGAFAKYATYLGVGAQSTERAFLRVLSGAREFTPIKVHRPKSWLASSFNARWVLAGMLLAAALLVGSYVAWQVASFVRLPELALMEPSTETAQQPEVVVRGRAAADARVQVNGEQVLLERDGTFVAPLRLAPGINVVVAEAANAAGRVRTVRKDILLPRQ